LSGSPPERPDRAARRAARAAAPPFLQGAADAFGRPLRTVVTAGQRGDVKEADTRLDAQTGGARPADKAFDANARRAVMGADAVIPSNRI
jgi:hypothetical protein